MHAHFVAATAAAVRPALTAEPPCPVPASFYCRRGKRLLDLLLLAPLAVVLAPLCLVAALPLLVAPGAVLFRQTRLGLDGRPFTIYKLRTCTGAAGALPAPRPTAYGRLLRRLHWDEIPQLWNVLRGDMSLVGPRPEQPHEYERLADLVPEFRWRLRQRPGLTGWAQIHLLRVETVAEQRQKLRLDLAYQADCRLSRDLQVLLRTSAMALTGFARWSERRVGSACAEVVAKGPSDGNARSAQRPLTRAAAAAETSSSRRDPA